MNLKNINILIYGLGKSGMACINFLRQKGINFFIFDDDKEKLNRYKKNGFLILNKENIDIFNLVIVSPGIDKNNKIIKHFIAKNIKIVSEVEFAYNMISKEKIVAITGTNGKTTTTEIVGDLLANEYMVYKCGNIGTPLINYANSSSANKFYVVEVSSFQLEDIDKFKPKYAIITNLAEDHLNRYNSFFEYVKTKFKITKNQDELDYLILNEKLFNYNIQTNAKKLYFSTENEVVGVYAEEYKIYSNLDNEKKFLFELPNCISKTNLENMLASICVALLEKIPKEKILKTLLNFQQPCHRFEKITTINGIEFVNDSKATNIHATLNAVKNINKNIKIHLLLGGSDKGENFNNLFSKLKNNVVAYLFGCTANKMVYSCNDVGFKNFKLSLNMKDALEKAYNNAKSGDIVLLSPACASFDSYKNFEERGTMFKELVFSLNVIKND